MADDKPIIQSVTIAELANAVEVAVSTETPLLALGAPGIGKTQIMKQKAQQMGAQYTEVVLGGRDIGNVMMPYIKPGDGLAHHYNPALPIKGNPRFHANSPIVLNFDEVDKANRLMQAVLLKALDEHLIGEAELMDNVVIVATGNRVWDMAGAEQFNSAVANRGTVLHFDVDVDFWLDYALTHDFHPLCLAWVKFDPSNLFAFDSKAFLAGDYAFASPRSNEKLSRLVHAWEARRMSDRLFRAEVCGTIGSARGVKFAGYIKIQSKLPDYDAILAGKKASVPEEPAVIYASIAALIQRSDKATLGHVCKWMDLLSPEWHLLFTKQLSFAKPALVATQAWSQWLVEHTSTLT